MKKAISLILILVLLFSLSLCAGAEEKTSFANAVELMEYWGEVGYPDDVGSIYSTDGTANNLTIQLIGDTDGSRAAEIAAMLDDPGTVTFEAGLFSDHDLHAISENIRTELMPNDDGIKSCSVGWGKKGGFGVSGQELRVVVNVDEARVEEYAASLAQRYGEAVVVEAAREQAASEAQSVSDSEKISSEAPADAQPGLSESDPERISEKTESIIISTVLLGILLVLLVVFVIYLIKKKNKR